MRFLYISIISFFMLNPSLAQELPTIKSYIENKERTLHDSFIYGLENGIEWLNEYSYTKHGVQIYCKPNDLILSVKQLKKFIDEEIATENTFYDKYQDAPLLGLALRNAYISNFPCN
tara:strand:- start:426 stop:776 length:351 start_codon:yes stop_codon:yes gene_type:complete